ncbi:hypothetical protein, partial [Aerococcus mictus]
MRVLIHTLFGIGQPDGLEHGDRAIAGIFPEGKPVGFQTLRHLAANGNHLVEGGHGFLEHHAHFGA